MRRLITMVIGVITVALRLFICGREFAAVPEISTVIYSRSEGGVTYLHAHPP
jgi:hypothetical protein